MSVRLMYVLTMARDPHFLNCGLVQMFSLNVLSHGTMTVFGLWPVELLPEIPPPLLGNEVLEMSCGQKRGYWFSKGKSEV